MFNFVLSIFELRYNEVHCHSLKLYPFLFSKIITLSRNLDHCSRKVRHFLKYPTVTVKILTSSLKFISLGRENKAFNYTLKKLEKFAQFINLSRQTSCFERSKNHLRRSRCIQNGYVTSKKRRKNAAWNHGKNA